MPESSVDLRTDFERAVTAHRREVLAFCYRMLGSVDDAEDAVQETMLRAWRAADRYDPSRASVRTWLYRIATNVCLTSIGGRRRRALPAALGAPSTDPTTPLVASTEVAWLQPLPDRFLADDDPAATAVQRSHLRLALVAALQHLPARQRAAVILREVLDWSAVEIAELLGTTPAAVNSALQRARTTLARRGGRPAGSVDDAAARRFVDAYAAAFARADLGAIRELVTADVILEMPPVPVWFAGRDDFVRFMERVYATRGTGWRMVPTSANTQPAATAYAPHDAGAVALHSYQVFDVDGGGISRVTVFYDHPMLRRLGVPGSPPGA